MKTLISFCLMLFCTSFAFAQVQLKGKIKANAGGESLTGATVELKPLLRKTVTDKAGVFEFSNIKPGVYTLRVSFIGFKTLEQTVELKESLDLTLVLMENEILSDEVIVSSLKIDDRTPIAHTNIEKEEIQKRNLGQDLPYLLNLTPSAVITSDAGNGVGYTGIRIRGTDPTRVNVTVNGIPLNDAESHGVFYVNMPDFAQSVDNIQIQRGAGTSTNGAGAFGASVNLQTTKLNPEAYALISNSIGSYNTIKNSVNIGSGLINNKFNFEGRLSQISSDGYINPGWSKLKSYYLSGTYYGKKSSLKITTFAGKEKTYQAWWGLRDTMLNINRRANLFSYPDQTDNYWQDHYQLHYNYNLTNTITLTTALHYTKGKGYYEEFKDNQEFVSYGLTNVIMGTDTITTTDLVRRRWLDNDFYGGIWSLNYWSKDKRLNIIWGGGANQYTGAHFGEIIWSKLASNGSIYQKYYHDDATKNDFNSYLKTWYMVTEKLNVFADLQMRKIYYSFLGYDRNLNNVQQDAQLTFFNPKAGVTYTLNSKQNLYASFSVANKEPNRDDYTNSSPDSRPLHETLNDIEAGYKFNSNRVAFGINAYYMMYKNQLILTGEINDVGAYNRINVKDSYRRGVELELGALLAKGLRWNGNLTLSQSKVAMFTEFIDDYDNGGQLKVEHKNTNIAFSPSIISASQFIYTPCKGVDLNFITKYVGKQYLDNTSNNGRVIDAFLVNDLRIDYKLVTKNWFKEIRFGLMANNLFNELYENNGYTFSYIWGGQTITENFYYPQATRNFMGNITLKF